MATLLDIVKKDSTNRSVTIRIIDSTDGTPETGVVFNTSGIDFWYRREGGLKVVITEADLATPALDDAHADGGFLHISDGEYRLDLPDAAFATGVNHVDVGGTVTGMVVIGGRVRLVDYDPEDAVALGLSLMPANVIQLGSAAQSLTDLKDFADDGYDPATNKVTGVLLADTVTTLTNLPTIPANWLTAAGIAADAIGASELAADAVTEIRDAITGGAYALDTDANGRLRIVDGTGTGELDTASGLIAGIAGTKNTFDDLNDITAASVMTTQLTESYAADGVAPTPAQSMMLIQQHLTEFAIASTTWTTKKIDGSTTAATFTLDDATSPTSLTRAS